MSKDVKAGIAAVVTVVGSIILIILFFCSYTTIPAGHVGIITSFGSVDPEPLPEGFHWVAFWKRVTKMSIQLQEKKETASCPTKKGLSVNIEASIIYSLSGDSAAQIYKTVGTDYPMILVEPQFRSVMRNATTKFEAEDLYTANREQIELALTNLIREELQPRGVIVHSVLLRNIELPAMVRERIEAKLAADQDSQRMEYILLKEKQEAERKKVEARGIADAQEIIKKDLSHEYLVYLWIEALKEGAKHNNAVIYIPTGSDGMPMFKQVEHKK